MCIYIPSHVAKLILIDENDHRDHARYYYRLCRHDRVDILLKTGAKLYYSCDRGFLISGYDRSGSDVLPYVEEYGLGYLVA